jgi:hypothetical protein
VVWLPLLTITAQGAVGQPYPDYPPGRAQLSPGDILNSGDSLVSPNGWYVALMQPDGNFVIYNKAHTVIWHTRTYGNPGARIMYQTDGNLVVYAAGGFTPLYNTSTGGTSPGRLLLQDDGNLVIYDGSNTPVWNIGYGTSTEPRETILRVVSNTENIISRGQLFSATFFEITMPTDNGETLPTVELKIANVDGLLIQTIRGFANPPQMKLELVLSTTPDIVERSVDWLVLKSVDYNALTISGRLTVESVLSQRFPAYDFCPPYYPGLFA